MRDENQVAKDMGRAIGTFDLISAISARGLSPAWNRSQEDAADVLGLDLIKAEGINAPVYEAMFNALHQHESLSTQLTKELESSVSKISQQALQPATLEQMLGGNAEAVGNNLLNSLTSQVAKGARDRVVAYFGQTHRPPDVRLKGVQGYELKAYPGITAESRDIAAFEEAPTTTALDAIRSSAEFRDASAATVAYYESIYKRSKLDYAGAEASISRALMTRFGPQAAIQFEAGRVAENAGRPDLARQRYRAALTATPLPEAYRQLARLEVRSGAYGEAEKTISDGIKVLNDADYFYPSKINLAVAREEVEPAMELVRLCRATERSELVAACEASHAGLDPSQLTAEQKAFFERQGALGANPADSMADNLGKLFSAPKIP